MEKRFVIVTARNEYYFPNKTELIDALLKLTSNGLTAICWDEIDVDTMNIPTSEGHRD